MTDREPLEAMDARLDALGRAENTRREQLAVFSLIHASARDEDDMLLLIDALGLNGRPMRTSAGGRKRVSPVVHGTRSGVRAHRDAGTRLCEACRRWARVYEAPVEVTPPKRAECGTHGAWIAHLRAGEDFDEKCATYAEWRRSRCRKGPRGPVPECGTDAAWQAHRRRGEEPDEACHEAHAEANRRWKAGRRARAVTADA